MMVSPNLPQILEVGFQLLSVAVGLIVLLLALRVAPTLTLSSHRYTMLIFVIAAIVIVSSEVMGVLGPFFRASTFVDVAEEFAELVAISSVGLALYLMNRAEREEIASLRRSANVDELTNLSSRSFFHRAASRRLELSNKHNLPLACAMVDVDDFKAYNDRYGHEGGDKVLRCIADVLRGWTRAEDLIARYGGEEFILLMSSEMEDAAEVGERIRQGVELECTPERDASLDRPITISLGIVPLTEDIQTLEQLIGAADRQMYRAKRAGKNRISVVGNL
jgi:diguanylate cyclase (GGDEF)-like protein